MNKYKLTSVIVLLVVTVVFLSSLAKADETSAKEIVKLCLANKRDKVSYSNEFIGIRNSFIHNNDLRSVVSLDDRYFSSLMSDQLTDLKCLEAIKAELE